MASFLLIFVGMSVCVWHWCWPVLTPDVRRDAALRILATGRQMLPAFAVAGVIFVGHCAVSLGDAARSAAEGDFFASGGGFADVFSADLLGYLVPTRLHPLLGEWVATLPFPNDKGQHIFIGYSALVLAMAGLWAA